MISIILPVRNAMPFLPEALASIFAQAVLATEVIVVDGGSTDGSLAYASSLPQVCVIPQRGRGLAGARNEGLATARGEFIAFLDADDLWPADSLAIRTTYLAEHPDCTLVIGQLVRFLHSTVALPPRYANGWLAAPAPGYTPGALVARRAAWERLGGFDEQLTVGCDSDWFARALDAGEEVALLPQVVLHKRIHAGNLSIQVERYRQELLTLARRSLLRRGHLVGPQ